MQKTPKSLRLQLGVFGRTNVGKSSFLNYVAGQDVAITSPVPGTTTDVVEKPMELLPIGPVLFLDTAGLDDVSELAAKRLAKTRKIMERCDVAVVVTEPRGWTDFERSVLTDAQQKVIQALVVINKIDTAAAAPELLSELAEKKVPYISVNSLDDKQRENAVRAFKEKLIQICPEEFLNPPSLVGDLLPAGGMAVMIVPIDLEAPKGRLILPQVQTIRDVLDADSAVLVVKDREYKAFLDRLKQPPDLVVCDSQVVLKMVADTPPAVKCTTFSILFSRLKGDLPEMVRGVFAIDNLKAGDKILVSEACSHHPLQDDIGRVKIPRWIRQYLGRDVIIDVVAGHDYPENLKDYKLIVHCGSCMLNRREMLWRIDQARQAGVAITNYGVCISYVQGVLNRVLSPFPAALQVYKEVKSSK